MKGKGNVALAYLDDRQPCANSKFHYAFSGFHFTNENLFFKTHTTCI